MRYLGNPSTDFDDISIADLDSIGQKHSNFKNARWQKNRRGAIYIHKVLTNFAKIWHDDASLSSVPHQPIKFEDFINPRLQTAAISKIQQNCDISKTV